MPKSVHQQSKKKDPCSYRFAASRSEDVPSWKGRLEWAWGQDVWQKLSYCCQPGDDLWGLRLWALSASRMRAVLPRGTKYLKCLQIENDINIHGSKTFWNRPPGSIVMQMFITISTSRFKSHFFSSKGLEWWILNAWISWVAAGLTGHET